MNPEPHAREVLDEPPPFLRTWGRVYAGVLCYLGALIALLYVITQHFKY
ncbi:MAG: hypothetical protein ACRD45_00790 [Bryobacteraceae bacterium]